MHTGCRKIMVQGTMSSVGKSFLTAGLCRLLTDEGYRVAPFKSQNMSRFSCRLSDGKKISTAQALQATACRKDPDVRMNPILLRPLSDTGSEVIINGEISGQYSAAEYFKLKRELVPTILSSYESLAQENDFLIIEGAGSPAEINLRSHDIVNMGLAELLDSKVILVGDIDRGGVFAQLVGTLILLTADERARVLGTVINKFRGDKSLLDPGILQLEEHTKVPNLGVIPWMSLNLPEEDSQDAALYPRVGASNWADVDLDLDRMATTLRQQLDWQYILENI